ncbi:MAG TPA: nitrite/sulfite reductase [Terriglobales bacterium]|nr:nitrite/sulfite reductase [Terriglobales bacterium]
MRPTDADHRAALEAHADRIRRYQQGKLSADEFRPIRLGYGLYYQLDHTSHMQRIKLPGGLLDAKQVRLLADVAEDYCRGVLHVTTRQDVQGHWLDLDDVMPLYQRLHDVGITTRGACADTLRNVTGCIHAGTYPGELFDVTPYVMAVHEYFLFHPLNLTQPRKFKIGFATCEYDCIQARINEIAYFPKMRDGQRGFSAFAAGGLGSQPHLAQPLRDFVADDDLLILTEAVVRLQHRSGERKNRKRARMKYLYQRLGAERFRAEVNEIYDRIAADHGDEMRAELREMVDSFPVTHPTHAPAPLPHTADASFAHWLRTNTYAQSQSGYFGATIQLPLGDVTSAQLRVIADLTEQCGAGELRTANDQNMMVPWIPGDRLEAFYRRLGEIDLAAANAFHITDVVSCPGADYCSLAMSRSMGVAELIREHLEQTNGNVEDLGVFRIRISGCPNSCGQHQVGDIGLTGLSLKGADGQFHPHYSMLIGGVVGEEAQLGARVSGRFPVAEVPKVVAALADYYRTNRIAGERFGSFVHRVGHDRVTEVARGAAAVVV